MSENQHGKPSTTRRTAAVAADGCKCCDWASGASADQIYRDYHDDEWGVPLHDDRRLFEFLVLEGAQAGLSWRTVLGKRENYRRAFHGFDIARVAAMRDDELETLLHDPGLIRNRLKIGSARDNARAALVMIDEYTSLDAGLWALAGGQTRVNRWSSHGQVPASTEVSESMSKSLRKRGFRFVGPTICYAFMQATGMVNDHLTTCFRHPCHSARQRKASA
jgi:DNA-3-methyladenine glycosylase I